MTRFLLTWAIVGCATVVVLPSAAWATTPTDFVRQQTDALLDIINRDVEPGTPPFRQRQNDLKAAVRGFIDFEELCRRALGSHWDARTPEEQAQFVELMTRLIETNYTVKLGDKQLTNPYEAVYADELTRDQYAMVSGTVTYEDQLTAVEIFMIQREDSWIVYDIVTDDVSIQETYAESFDEIIADEGWDALVQRLEDRITELEEELETQAQGG